MLNPARPHPDERTAGPRQESEITLLAAARTKRQEAKKRSMIPRGRDGRVLC